MKSATRRLVVAVVLSASVMLVIPAAGFAVTRQHATAYLRAHAAVTRIFGARAAGCQLIGRHRTCHTRHVTDAQVVASIVVLHRYFAPPPPAPAPVSTPAPVSSIPTASSYTSTSSYTASAPSYSTGGSGGYTIPSSIVQCESGGNWSAVNPSSGAGGAYQILPSTWAAYGGQGLPQDASPQEQGIIAARVMAGQGRGAWTC